MVRVPLTSGDDVRLAIGRGSARPFCRPPRHPRISCIPPPASTPFNRRRLCEASQIGRPRPPQKHPPQNEGEGVCVGCAREETGSGRLEAGRVRPRLGSRPGVFDSKQSLGNHPEARRRRFDSPSTETTLAGSPSRASSSSSNKPPPCSTRGPGKTLCRRDPLAEERTNRSEREERERERERKRERIIFGSEARGTSRDMDNVQMIGTKITAIKEYLYNFARTHSPTRLMSSENTYSLSKEHCNLKYSDILPQNAQGFPATKEFLMKVVDILLDFIKSTCDRNAKVLDFHHPSEMMRLLDLEIPDTGVTLQQLLLDCSTTLKYQVKTGHPHFFNQLSCGLDLVSMAGEWLTATANTNMFTYEIAPVFILMEHVVLQKMRELIGWSGGDSILAPGGSISNLYAFLAARHRMFPAYKERGLAAIGGQLVMFTSDQCHYSVKSCAAVCGLGTDNCVMVPSDERGRIIPSKLEELILERKARGHIPFFVNATAGTTVIGAFDSISEMADICQKYKLWLHIDAAWGGGLLLSRRYRHPRLTGIERADSVTWNPHKLMGALLQCSTIHFKEDGLLISCNQMSAEYLFMTDKLYDVKYDTGDKVIQCGRHNDIFKLWLQWRAKGTEGFEKHMDRLMELTEYMVRRIKQMPDKYYLILEPEMVNVCFWYLPARARNMPHGPEREKILAEICPILKGRMMEAGTLMVGYQPDDRRPNFFRNIISSAAVTEVDVDFLLSEMDRLGHDL